MTSPWIGEMSADFRATRLRFSTDGEGLFIQNLTAAIADAEARARVRALGQVRDAVAVALAGAEAVAADTGNIFLIGSVEALKQVAAAIDALAERQP